jgi:hypothetical protein
MFITHFFICRLLQCIQWVYFIALNKLFLWLMKLEVTSLNILYDIKVSGFVCAAMIVMCSLIS